MSRAAGRPNAGPNLVGGSRAMLRDPRKARQRIAGVALLSFAALASGRACEAGSGEVARGRALAQRLCAVCHLNPGQGEKAGPGSIPGFEAVARRPGQTLEGIVAWLKSVPPMMPDHHLSQDEMTALAEFILSLAGETPG